MLPVWGCVYRFDYISDFASFIVTRIYLHLTPNCNVPIDREKSAKDSVISTKLLPQQKCSDFRTAIRVWGRRNVHVLWTVNWWIEAGLMGQSHTILTTSVKSHSYQISDFYEEHHILPSLMGKKLVSWVYHLCVGDLFQSSDSKKPMGNWCTTR